MAANNNRLSPRQKMINLMYIVLTAMLALNVSSDVLNGFTQVEDGLKRTNENVEQRNAAIMDALKAFSEQNPDKGGPWYAKATEVRENTRELFELVDSLKHLIVMKADGKDGDVNNISNRDDLESAAVVMLNPTNQRGRRLRLDIDAYREYITTLIADPAKRKSIEAALSTDPVNTPGVNAESLWEEAKFDNQPVVAAVTLLTKLQNDIKYAEGETLATLMDNVDAGDVRVNELNAFVIPQSRFVMRGGKYQANIVLAAVDTTQRPSIYVNGSLLANNHGTYETVAGASGNYDYKGYLEVPHGDGTVTRHEFESSYTVIDPTATVSATMMNVLYAGIDNPISISVPGVANTGVTATISNGTLTRQGDHWIARPANVGQEAVITVSADMDGRRMDMSQTKFRVRKLPDPTPFIIYNDAQGNRELYRSGSGAIAKGALRQSPGIEAAIDDELLNIAFNVQSFETVFFDSMGNASIERSEGSAFSQRQLDRFSRMRSGQRFYISQVKAVGPDGVSRTLAPIEVIVK
ncbi:MAG: gliding motility protein GldM [Bacteroidales bacterium]|nr:gliding motility protein GldM [Bacteroidales bacterium]